MDEAIQPPKWKDSPVSWDFLMYLMGGQSKVIPKSRVPLRSILPLSSFSRVEIRIIAKL